MTKAGHIRRGKLHGSTRHLHWFAAAFGIMASCACAAFLISSPIGTPQFQTLASSWDDLDRISGLGGTTFNVTRQRAMADQIIDPDAKPAQNAAWNQIETPGCLTVTTENGQKLSFRIEGYRAASDKSKQAPVKVDLSVSACTQSSTKVVNAVLEPDESDTTTKAHLSEHSL
ncbi:MAG: hypothetical protein KTR19_09570 [Hyphomicrobiales bacterium]|nr:hypothetical protein [Hyphomicrobiales bacterium]